MNLFINIYLTPDGLGTYFRGQLPRDDKLDIFKFSLNSLASIPYWNEVHIYCKLNETYHSRQQELENYISKYFSKYKLILEWERNETQEEWRRAIQPLIDSPDNITYFSNNHDHIFTGQLSTINSITKELNKNTEKEWRQVYSTHWPEIISGAYFGCDGLTSNGYYKLYEDFVGFLLDPRDGIQVITKNTLYHWFFESEYGELRFGRMDGRNESKYQNTKQRTETLVPLIECFRHYDGYNRGNDLCLALIIPPDFFKEEEKIIKYGYQETYKGCVNINSKKSPRDIDWNNGSDYYHCYKFIPEIFKFNNYTIDRNLEIKEEDLENNYYSIIRNILNFRISKMNREHGFNQEIDQDFIEKIVNYAVTQ